MSDQGAQDAPQPCQPCSGSGTVISNLGGSPSTVECPWCDGSGVLAPGHDAQARWRAEAGRTSDGDGA